MLLNFLLVVFNFVVLEDQSFKFSVVTSLPKKIAKSADVDIDY